MQFGHYTSHIGQLAHARTIMMAELCSNWVRRIVLGQMACVSDGLNHSILFTDIIGKLSFG